jgi:hypothetical protein
MSDERSWRLLDTRRTWATKDHTEILCYQGIAGRVLIPELIAAFEEAGVDWRKVALNFATATWNDLPTDDEIARQSKWDADQRERTERWERETLARLTTKYADGVS